MALTGLMLLAVQAVFPAYAYGQDKVNIKGTVIDAQGQPVIGATVMIDGTQSGVTTDMDGLYTFNGVPSDATLKNNKGLFTFYRSPAFRDQAPFH